MNATYEHAKAVYDAQYNAGEPCIVYPFEGTRWHLAGSFVDVHGNHCATWQLLKSDCRGAAYSLTLSDGIPVEELAPERLSSRDRVMLRDQCSYIERKRIGIQETI